MSKAVVNKDKCIACEACIGICPVSAISIEEGTAAVDPEACIECGACVMTCPIGAIEQ